MRYTCTLDSHAARSARDWQLELQASLHGEPSSITIAHRVRGRISTLEWLCNGEPVNPDEIELDAQNLQRFRQATADFLKTKPNSCAPA